MPKLAVKWEFITSARWAVSTKVGNHGRTAEMIRLRIERFTLLELSDASKSAKQGLMWFENGELVGRVIIEQSTMIPETNDQGFESSAFGWVPVEVIDDKES